MDKERMIFEIDRHTVTEGDVVELSWRCQEAESVLLTIDNGFKKTDISLESTGTKRFRLNRSKGRTHLTLAVTVMGKTYRKKISVRVKKVPTVKAETVDHNGRPMGAVKQWWQKCMTNCRNYFARLKMTVQALPERKQMAVKMLTGIGLLMMLSALWPAFYHYAMTFLVIYLIIVLIKR